MEQLRALVTFLALLLLVFFSSSSSSSVHSAAVGVHGREHEKHVHSAAVGVHGREHEKQGRRQRRPRINHGSFRGPRKHLVNPTVESPFEFNKFFQQLKDVMLEGLGAMIDGRITRQGGGRGLAPGASGSMEAPSCLTGRSRKMIMLNEVFKNSSLTTILSIYHHTYVENRRFWWWTLNWLVRSLSRGSIRCSTGLNSTAISMSCVVAEVAPATVVGDGVDSKRKLEGMGEGEEVKLVDGVVTSGMGIDGKGRCSGRSKAEERDLCWWSRLGNGGRRGRGKAVGAWEGECKQDEREKLAGEVRTEKEEVGWGLGVVLFLIRFI
ncbi:hypothetical protein ACH5RR_040654 [Cinchona calisaya]|uniref:Uncharacterized protein n=1 Tax=Cinchona calisaya TaxID=153742 RepID=A0ABD2XS49_9GENT